LYTLTSWRHTKQQEFGTRYRSHGLKDTCFTCSGSSEFIFSGHCWYAMARSSTKTPAALLVTCREGAGEIAALSCHEVLSYAWRRTLNMTWSGFWRNIRRSLTMLSVL